MQCVVPLTPWAASVYIFCPDALKGKLLSSSTAAAVAQQRIAAQRGLPQSAPSQRAPVASGEQYVGKLTEEFNRKWTLFAGDLFQAPVQKFLLKLSASVRSTPL